ncbi:MAG: hypothetical protein ABI587_06250 [Gemmatimonadales bacterium]
MQRATHLKLDTVRHILEFSRRHPEAASTTIPKLVARLERLSGRVRTLLEHQLIWQQEIAGVRRERDRLAAALRPRLTRLIRLGDAAADAAGGGGDPSLRLTETRLATSPGSFLQHARAILDAAVACRAALIEFGLPEQLLEEIQDEFAACDAAHLRTIELAHECLTANAELDSIATQAFQTLRQLDALNGLRFAADPPLLEEWERSAAVAWPVVRRETESV